MASECLGTAWMTLPLVLEAACLGDTGDPPGLAPGWRIPVVGDNIGIPPLSCLARTRLSVIWVLAKVSRYLFWKLVS